MKIVEVQNKKEEKLFLNVVDKIYQGDNIYIRPLDESIKEIFSETTNVLFLHGECVRFILINNCSEVIGRVAAFINNKKAYGFQQPTGGIGFFECVNDKEAGFLLLNTAQKWLVQRGMEAMDGPINFGENDSFWGLLVDGFTSPGFGMPYNPPYYKDIFEEYGFTIYFEQITNHLSLDKPFPERFWKIAEWIAQKPDYRFEHFKWQEEEKFLDDFKTIYDDAWQFHENFVPVNIEPLRNELRKAKLFIEEKLIWFAYHQNRPIGFIVVYPDINQLIKGFKGRLNWFNKLRMYYGKLTHKITRGRVVILGVRPKYQRSGVESGLFWYLKGAIEHMPQLKELELSWVGDFNPKMRSLHESLGADFGKKHITFRYLFDSSKRELQRAATIPYNTKEHSQ